MLICEYYFGCSSIWLQIGYLVSPTGALSNALMSHLLTAQIRPGHYQSACWAFRSAGAALLEIRGDILASMGAGRVIALTLLDLSAAFHTIDHTVLLGRLDDWFGVTGKALNWFGSYLTGRCQRIKIGDVCGPRPISNFESLRYRFWVLCFSRSIPLH